MKNAAEPGKCTRCNYQDATRAHECDPCHRVTLCMTIVHSIWKFEELEDLAKGLMAGSFKTVYDNAKESGAYLRLKLLNAIRSVSVPSVITPDDMRRRVAFAIQEYVREIEGYRKWEAKPGNAGKWMEFWRAAFDDVFKKVSQIKP